MAKKVIAKKETFEEDEDFAVESKAPVKAKADTESKRRQAHAARFGEVKARALFEAEQKTGKRWPDPAVLKR